MLMFLNFLLLISFCLCHARRIILISMGVHFNTTNHRIRTRWNAADGIYGIENFGLFYIMLSGVNVIILFYNLIFNSVAITFRYLIKLTTKSVSNFVCDVTLNRHPFLLAVRKYQQLVFWVVHRRKKRIMLMLHSGNKLNISFRSFADILLIMPNISLSNDHFVVEARNAIVGCHRRRIRVRM